MYSALTFSRDGKRLVTVGDYPTYTLKVWEDEVELVSIDLEQEPLKIIMHSDIILLFKHEIRKVTLEKAFELPELISGDLQEIYRYYETSYQLAETMPLDAVLDKFGQLYVATNAQEILILQGDLKEVRMIHKLEFNVLSLALTHRFLICATSDNKVQWINIYIPPEEVDPRYGKNLNMKIAKELILDEPQDIIQLLYSGDFSKLILVGAQGKLQILHQPAELDFDAEEDEDEHEEGGDDDYYDYDDEDEANRKPKAILATPQVLGNFHVGTIRQVICLGDSTQCASIAEDLRVWEVVTGENIMQYQPPADVEFTSIDANITGCVLVVGSSNGVIRVFDVSNRMVCRLLAIHKLFDVIIDGLLISPDSKLVACVSSQSNQVYFIENSPNSQFRVIGYSEVAANIKSIAWYKRKLVMLIEGGLLGALDAPRPDTPSSVNSLLLPVQYRHIEDGLQIQIHQGAVYVTGCAKELYTYNIPEGELEDIQLHKPPETPYDIVPAHSVQSTVLAFSPDMRLWAIGSADGHLIVGEVKSQDFNVKHIHGPSGVQSISFSADSTLLFSTGKERDFFSWSLTGRTLDRAVPASITEDPQLEALDTLDDIPDDEVHKFIQILSDAIQKSEAREVERVKSKLKDSLIEIQKELQTMLNANDAAPELEKLDRDEFVLDLLEKEEMESQGQEKAEAMREEARRENLAKELLKERIRDKTWGSMLEQSRVIDSILKDDVVYNYAIRKLNNKENRHLKQARALRLIEMREQQGRKEQHIQEVYDNERFAVNWIVGKRSIDWDTHPLLQLLDSKRKEERKEGDPVPVSEWRLVYPPLMTYTPNRKRLQIFLLQLLIRALKMGFNVRFENLQLFKERQVDLIIEKNLAIAEKQKELQRPEKLFKIKTHILEEPDKMLQVDENEIAVEKYLTREQRVAQEEARRKEEERLRALNADDSKRRALNTMMWGTVETKKDTYSVLTEQLVREEWMNKPIDQMTDDERHRFKDFQDKEKKLQEEKDRLRKILEGELKNLQQQVKEIAEKFDTQLRDVSLLRITTDYEIYQLELVICKLKLSLLMEKKRKDDIKRLKLEVKQKRALYEKFKDLNLGFENQIDHMESRRARKEDKAKEVDVIFAKDLDKDMNPSVAEALKKLVRFGQNKPGAGVKRRLDPEAEQLLPQLNQLDPYSTSEKKELEQRFINEPPMEIDESHLPPNTQPYVAEKVIKKRKEKIKHQVKAALLQDKIKEARTYKQWIEKQAKKYENEHKQAAALLKEKEEEDHKETYNTDMLLSLRQAIVEVPQQPVVTDYSDAILIQREIIEKDNKQIREIGKEKVEILKKIAKSRTLLKQVEWEKEWLKLEYEHLEQCETDVKMLRIDKRLQNILAGRGLDENKLTSIRIDKQIKQLAENTEKRIKQIKEKEDILKKSIRELSIENDRIEDEIHEMKQQSKQRSELFEIKKKVSDQARHDPVGKFKQISGRRQLLDQIKTHAEEIEFLKDELDRLRAKTFPSFAHLQAHVDYPDEYQ